jgi:dipeptidase D
MLDHDSKTGEALVRANGTTLGADNGVGLALAFAAATSPEVVHGPLELLCTIDEEMGMSGAKVLAPDFIRGRRMLNLDAEEDDALYIGCAGGCDTTLTWELKTSPPPQRAAAGRITVSGLRGGHSGVDIHLNRANAIKLLVEILTAVPPGRLRLAEIHGGSKRNVIPREASVLVVGAASTLKGLSAAAQVAQAAAVRSGEASCAITVEKAPATSAAATAKDTQRLLTALTALPHGVLAVVPDIAGLVQTSNSTSTVESTPGDGKLCVAVGCLSRSSLAPQLQTTARQLRAIGELAGAAVESGNQYPGWQPNANSPLLATCRRVYERLFGKGPHVTAIHAGVECGIIGERIGAGQMDMVSLGPHIEGAHSPDERVYVASVQKTWKYLTTLLAELARA